MTNSSNRKLWLEYVCNGKKERDRDLLSRASETLEKNICYGKEYPWYPLRAMVPSQFTYKGIWNWDAAFHALGVKYWDPELAYEQCKVFWETQTETGMLLDVWHANGEKAKDFTKPPVFPWAFESIYRISPNREYLEKAYEVYTKNEKFWCDRRMKDNMFFYGCEVNPVIENYAKCESGWDTSVRFDDGITNMWSIDLNCYMIMMYRSLQFMAQELGLKNERESWHQKEIALAKQICSRLWDDKEQYFCDTYFKDEKHSKTLSPASFMPLYLGIASKEQADAMFKLYLKHFHPGMPSVSYLDSKYESNNYWRGPCWLNISYFALKGLKNYGYTEEAEKGRQLILDWCDKEKRGIFEYYDSKSGKGLGAVQYGWSSAFIIEFILNF